MTAAIPPAPTPPNRPTREGGFTALIGYIYQLIGSGAYLIEKLDPPRNTADGGLESLLSFEIEAYNQDAVGTTSGGLGKQRRRELLQFKYSLTEADIPPSELDEILEALQKSEEEANASDPLPTTYVLRTNRGLSPECKRAIADAISGKPNDTLDFKRNWKPEGKGRKHTKTPRTADFRRMLKDLRYEVVSSEDAQERIESYARRLGVNQPSEYRQGFSNILSLLLKVATDRASRRLDPEDFDTALAGFPQPRPLTVSHLAPKLQLHLREQRELRLGVKAEDLVRRSEIINELFRDLGNAALIVIWGGGGCGKSILAWELLDTVLSQSTASQRLAAALFAGEDHRLSIGEVIASWRSRTSIAFLAETPEVAISRIIDANPEASPPILFLGLDGVDELPFDASWREKVRQIIRYFWKMHQDVSQPPTARLLVTCRKLGDLDEFIGTRGFGSIGVPPRSVPVDVFSPDELATLCRKTLLPNVADLVFSALPPLDAPVPIADVPARGSPKGARGLVPENAGPAFVSALRHPIVWRCFAQLSSDDQQAALSRGPAARAAVQNLCKIYLKWFCDKASLRQLFDPLETKVSLGTIVGHCPDFLKTYELRGDWIAPLRSAVHGSELKARRLYQESIASGLIVDVPGAGDSDLQPSRWKWRYEFLPNHLPRLCS